MTDPTNNLFLRHPEDVCPVCYSSLRDTYPGTSLRPCPRGCELPDPDAA